MKRIYNLTGIFHVAIIAVNLLSFGGCGYKDNPYHLDSAPQSDKNVKFFIKKPSGDNNESSK